MKIKNIEGLSALQLQQLAEEGARFVYFEYCVSLLFITLKKTSGVYLLRAGENPALRGAPYTCCTLLLGWWGIPFGPKHSLAAIRKNLKGGNDVTDEVMATVAGFLLFEESQHKRFARSA